MENIYKKIWSNFQDDIWVFCIVNSEILFCKNEFKKLKKKRKTNIENSMKCPKIFLMELSIPLNDRQNKWINREVEILIFDHQKITEVELKKSSTTHWKKFNVISNSYLIKKW